MNLLNTGDARRAGWVFLAVVGTPALLIGLLYLIGFPLALLAFAAGMIAGRSSRMHMVALVGLGAVALVVGQWALDRDSAAAMWLAISTLAAFAAVYKAGNLARLRLLPR